MYIFFSFFSLSICGKPSVCHTLGLVQRFKHLSSQPLCPRCLRTANKSDDHGVLGASSLIWEESRAGLKEWRHPMFKLPVMERAYHLQEYCESQSSERSNPSPFILYSVGQSLGSKTSWHLYLVPGIVFPSLVSQFLSLLISSTRMASGQG